MPVVLASVSSSSSESPRAAPRGFADLDDVLCGEGASGVLRVAATASAFEALSRHVARRAEDSSRPCFVVAPKDAEPDASVWRELSLHLGLDAGCDVEVVADAIASALASRRAIAVVGAPVGAWDAQVERAVVSRLSGPALVVLPRVGQVDARVDFVVEDDLDRAGSVRWWSAAASAAARLDRVPLAHLDAWWRGSVTALRTFDPAASRAPAVEPADRALLARLSLAGRAWPASRVSAFGALGSLSRLELSSAVRVAGDLVLVGAPIDGDVEDARATAAALARVFADDAWAHARAARLLARAGDAAAAEVALVRAVTLADDVNARADLWALWAALVDTLPVDARQGCRLRAAEIALARGDADPASLWAERAANAAPGDFGATLALGRAYLARGDVLGADATLQRALAGADTDADRARCLTEIAEVRYTQGRLDDAARHAHEALRLATVPSVRLAARNTLGKLLLARGAWTEAEAHFAEDAGLAACSGDASAQLRARLNRAIAVMWDGRSDEAKPMLESVLDEGRARADDRATAFALSNLAVLAVERHDYVEAVARSESAIVARRRIGERLGLARVIANLAQLRLCLGLVEQAEHALAFGRSAATQGDAAPRSAHLALVAASVRLARGDTLGARRELALALAGAPGSSDGDMLSDVHRLAARVAIEDGDLARADAEVELAEKHGTTPFARAEAQILRAMVARGRGLPPAALADAAVSLARASGALELLRDAHVLVAQIAMADGDTEGASRAVASAVALREQIVSSLPADLAASYVARRELLALARVERELSQSQATDEVESETPSRPRPSVRVTASGAQMVGRDPAITALLEDVRKVARADATVLVHGESGTGKELVAEAIHSASARRDAPLVKVNCAALVESLLLSELFGHEKGAFTGAVGKKRGRFEMAEGGTLFLDEIGDISPGTQVALLRVLQERTFERVGGTTPIRANVRVVCATHRDLRAMVEAGEFRQDLYFRLSGIVLHVPSLRARASDLPLLCRSLLARIGAERNEAPKTMSDAALALLARHRWPGNVRELENALRAASLFCDGEELSPEDFLQHVEGFRGMSLPAPKPVLRVVETDEDDDAPDAPSEGAVEGGSAEAIEIVYADLKAGRLGLFDAKRHLERECISRALSETKGNITRAAALLGMKRPRLSQLVKQYGLAATSSEDC